MILTFSDCIISCCAWADNNLLPAVCGCCKSTPITAHSASFMNIINISDEWSNHNREAPKDAGIKPIKLKKEERDKNKKGWILAVLACPLISVIKAPLWMSSFTGAAVTGLSCGWQGAEEQMVAAVTSGTSSLGGRRRVACFH